MSTKYPFVPPHLEKGLEDLSIPLIDLLHGHLKVEMLDLEEQIELVKDGNYHIESQDYLEGYMEALTSIYALTYNLSIDRKHLEETQ